MKRSQSTPKKQGVCEYISPEGKKCRSFAIDGKYCFVHSPKYKKQHALAVKKGFIAQQMRIKKIKSPLNARDILGNIILEILSGEASIKQLKVATSTAYLLKVWGELNRLGVEEIEYKKQLEDISQRLEKAGF